MKRATVILLEWTCTLLDRIPLREDGRWVIAGYGCRLGLGRRSAELDDAWATGVWHPAQSDTTNPYRIDQHQWPM